MNDNDDEIAKALTVISIFSLQTRTLVGIVCRLLLWAQASLVPRRRSTARIECHQPKYALIAFKS